MKNVKTKRKCPRGKIKTLGFDMKYMILGLIALSSFSSFAQTKPEYTFQVEFYCQVDTYTYSDGKFVSLDYSKLTGFTERLQYIGQSGPLAENIFKLDKNSLSSNNSGLETNIVTDSKTGAE